MHKIMSKKTNKCENCEFQAKTAGGLKSHMRAKHNAGSGRSVKFDLNIVNQQQANELVAHMAQLIATSGWLLLKQIMEGNIAVLEEAIIERKDPVSGEILNDAQLDDTRKKRALMKEMINKPEQLMEQFKPKTGENAPTYDPYAIDVRQFKESSRFGAPKASTLKTE